MATYQQTYDTLMGGSASIKQRLACAVSDYSMNTVAAEAGTVTGHATRAAFAKECCNNADGVAARFAVPVAVYCGNNNIAAPTDAQLLTAVGVVFNVMCGNV